VKEVIFNVTFESLWSIAGFESSANEVIPAHVMLLGKFSFMLCCASLYIIVRFVNHPVVTRYRYFMSETKLIAHNKLFVLHCSRR